MEPKCEIKVLIDNQTKNDLLKEWGLCIHIQYNDQSILLDTGASNRFLSNAEKLGVDISKVDAAVLSHAHYDHADGMEAFFNVNHHAPFYLREHSSENCYTKFWIFSKYIGIPKGIIKAHESQIRYAKGDEEIMEGVYLIPHKTLGLERIGKANKMYVKEQGKYQPDDFSHEQSLVLKTASGLVILNSCSHGGADNIIREVAETFKGEKIAAIIGGFHLYTVAEEKVRALAFRMKETGITKVYTGHCTGKRAFSILKEELGDSAEMLYTGMTLTF